MRIHSVQRTSSNILAMSLLRKSCVQFSNIYIQSHLFIIYYLTLSDETRSLTTSDCDHAFRSTRRYQWRISWKYMSHRIFSLNRTSMSRETRGAIRICTAHKHTKLKRPDYSTDPVSSFYLIQSLHLHATLSKFCQKYSMYKDKVCMYIYYIYKKKMHVLTKQGSLFYVIKCKMSHSLIKFLH